LVAGKKRVPRPATGRTAFRIGLFICFPFFDGSRFEETFA
jgi:hypothetical protein